MPCDDISASRSERQIASLARALRRIAVALALVVTTLVATGALESAPAFASPSCAAPPLTGSTTASGVVNTYFAGVTGSLLAGESDTTLDVGAGTGAGDSLEVGSLVLVIQMQGATIDSSNDSNYGAGDGTGRGATGGGLPAGQYEYATVASVAGSTIGLSGTGANGGLINTYTNADATSTSGQYRYQVILVPQYSSAALSAGAPPTAAAWDGQTGGVVALDVAATLDLSGADIDVSGLGFRPGLQRVRGGGSIGSNTDYVTQTSNPKNGQKAEGIAGTPVWTTGDPDSVGDGYPDGDFARGAPGNAGGGGTDGANGNNQNSGGGGGGNGGIGGRGGNTWSSALEIGGVGGAAVSAAVDRVVLGGGGGAGSDNNGVNDSSGGPGGGIVLIRAGALTGSGTITADGLDGQSSGQDGSGGAGAGGSVVVVTSETGAASGQSNLTISARGGRGGDETHPALHGPGGGGGGGAVITSETLPTVEVDGGDNGIHTASNTDYGAEPGLDGTWATTPITGSPGVNSGSQCIDLEVTKDVSPANVVPGAAVTYTVTVTNNGPFPTSGTAPVGVIDDVPAALSGVSWSCSATAGSSCAAASGTGDLSTTANLTIGGVATYTITGDLDAAFTGTLANTATATPPSGIPEITPDDNSDDGDSVATPQADLSITKTDGATVTDQGASTTYTIVVSNAGPSAVTNAAITDALPVGATSGTWTCANSAGGSCGDANGTLPMSTTADLDPSGSVTYTVVVDVSASATGNLVNTATVAAPAGVTEIGTGPNSATDTNAIDLVPVATADGYATDQDQDIAITVVANGLLDNDTEGTPTATVTSFDATSTEGGTVNVNPNGTFTYEPPAGYSGIDTFDYEITDGNGDTSSTTVTITIDDVPIAENDSYSATEDVTLVVPASSGLLIDDDQGDSPATVTSVDTTGLAGTISVFGADGSFTFVPNAGATGVTSFTYTITDANGDTSTATASIDIDALPTAVDDTYGTDEDATLTQGASGGLLDNDTDQGNGPATVTSVDTTGLAGSISTFGADGSFTFVPTPGFSGNTSFSYTITDADGDTSTATATIDVNALPTATADSFETNEDTSLVQGATGGLLDNDTDVGDGPITVTGVDTTGLAGSISTFGSDGSFTFVPTPGFTGDTSFSYTIEDANGDESTAVATITVDPTPTAEDDTYGTAEGVILNIAAPGVMDNDDLGTPGTTVTSIETTGTQGTVTVNSDGSLAYDPGTFTGTTAFDYTITDGNGDTSTATVTIVVDDLPLAEDDSYTTSEGATLSVPVGTGLLADDDLGDGPTTVTSIDTTGTSGTVTFNPDGSFDYDPGTFTGSTTFTYTLTDADGDESTATVTLLVDALPQAEDDAYGTDEDSQLVVPAADGLLDNDDEGNPNATVTSVDNSGLDGVVSVNSDGSFTFDPTPGFSGLTSFDYTITDDDGDESTATVTIDVNALPTAVADSFATDEDQTLTQGAVGGLLDNDTDVGDGPVTVTSIDTTGLAGTISTFGADGSFTFVPAPNTFGTTSFEYTITDANGDTSTATATIVVDAVPDAVNDGYVVDQDTDLTVLVADGVLDNDDQGTPSATVTSVDDSGLDGTVTVDGDGSFLFSPTPGFSGTTSFDYTITDSNGDTDTATATIIVDATPTAFDDSYATDEDLTLTVTAADGVLDNDLEGTPTATVTAIDTTGTAGTVTMDPDGSFVFVPTPGTSGTTTFEYTITDGNGDTDTGLVTIVVDALPLAEDDAYEVNEDTTLVVPAVSGLLVDDDQGTGPATVTSVDTTGTAGGVSFTPDGAFTFIPSTGFVGTTTFDYTITDSNGDTDTATATITVDAVPVAEDDSYEVDQDTNLVVPASTGLLIDDDQGTSPATVTAIDDSASDGDVTVFGSDGSFTFVPDAGFVGTTTFEYTIEDDNGDTSTATATVVVDDVPVAVADTYQATEDAVLTIPAVDGVLDNDVDQGTPTATVTAVDDSSTDGSVTFDADGAFEFTPDPGFTGTTTFTYTLTDGNGDSSTATVTIEVDALPEAADDSYGTDEGVALTISAPGVLGNDDQGNGPATVTGVDTTGTAGTVTEAADGSFLFTPTSGFTGSTTFDYTIEDADGDESTATVTIVVNDLPLASDDAYGVDEDTTLNVAVADGVLDNDDLGTGPTTVTGVDTTGTQGTVTMNPNGSFDFVPATGFVGTTTFDYTIEDANGATSTATVTIVVDDLPFAVADSYETDEDTSLTVPVGTGLLGNDDQGTGPATVTSVDTTGTQGTVTENADGSFDFVPTPGFTGDTTFTYTITDAAGATSTATVTITVDPTPTAVVDSYTTQQDVTINVPAAVGLLDNDDQGSGPATVTSVDTTGTQGTVTENADGSFDFVPTPGFTGTTTFDYTITDANGDTSSATVTITVEDTPDAEDDTDEGVEDATLVVSDPVDGVLANDDLGEGPTTVTAFDATAPSGSSITINADGTYTYVPAPGYDGVDSFDYTITDANGATSTATLTITLDALPAAVADPYTTDRDTTLVVANPSIGVLANDDQGTGPATVTTFDATSTNGGTVSLNPDGTFSYTPAPGFVGADLFDYTITDANGDISSAVVTVNVIDLPDAVDDNAVTDEDVAVVVTDPVDGLLANDGLGTGPTTVTFFDPVSVNGGVVVVNPDGTYTYTPAPGFSGTDTFTYTITDSNDEVSTATVTIEVDANPTAVNDAYPTDEGLAVTISDPALGLLDNDDEGTGPATVTAFDATSTGGGTVSVNPDGTFTYTPALGFTGNDTFTYTITDANGDESTATVTIAVGDIPLAVVDTATTTQDVVVEVTDPLLGLLANDDIGVGPTSVTSFDAASAGGGTVVVNPDGTYSYTPVPGFSGTDTFTYTITDANGATSTATVTIEVDGLPVAVADDYEIDQGDQLVVANPSSGVIGNDDQGDGPATVTSFDTASTGGGTIAMNPDGTFVYTPAVGFSGTDTFDYTIADSDGDTSTATVTIVVTDLPEAIVDSNTTIAGTTISVGDPALGLLANDDLGTGPTTITGFDATSANGGTVSVNPDGTYSYTPAAGFSGTDTFTYTITDANGVTSTAIVTIFVDPLPDAVADATTTFADIGITITDPADGVLGNDDLGAGPTTVTSFDSTSTGGGSVVVNPDGTYSYTPAVGFEGTDTFSYTITDSNGQTSTATVTVTVEPLPTAVGDFADVGSGSTLSVTDPADGVLSNDDLGAGPTTVTSFDSTSTGGGSVVVNPDGTYSYTPAVGFEGTDTFSYTITDSNGQTSTATVTVTVEPLPVAAPDVIIAESDVPLEVSDPAAGLIQNDDHGGGDATVSDFDTTSAQGGTVVVNPDGTYTYTPPTGFEGTDTFGYTITDTNGNTSTGIVTITVLSPSADPEPDPDPVPQPPVTPSPPTDPTTPTTPQTPVPQIPATGAESMQIVVLGSLLLSAGFVLLLLGRRRRHAVALPQ